MGSSREQTIEIRKALPPLLRRLGVTTLVDAPCGDFAWMNEIVDQIPFYKGIDIVPDLIEENRKRYESDRVKFFVADITRDPLPAGDAIMCRDCMIHLPLPLIHSALRNFKASGFKYVMLTHDEWINEYREIVIGGWRPVNWQTAPFHFPEPIARIDECPGHQRYLAVWELSALDALDFMSAG